MKTTLPKVTLREHRKRNGIPDPESNKKDSNAVTQSKTIREIVNCLESISNAFVTLKLRVFDLECKLRIFTWTTAVSIIIAVIALFTAVSAHRNSSSNSSTLTNSALKMEIKE